MNPNGNNPTGGVVERPEGPAQRLKLGKLGLDGKRLLAPPNGDPPAGTGPEPGSPGSPKNENLKN